MIVEDPHDVTYDPPHSVTLTESTDVTMEPSSPIHKISTCIVYENCLLELFEIFQAMQLQLYKYTTFRRLARSFIKPAIVYRWKTMQDATLEQLSQQQNVILGGDMRADSPGHSAKYGSYTMVDLRNNMIIDLQLVKSNEVGGSYHMEMEGLKRSLALLEERGVTLDSIVTDRHPQIQTFLKETRIKHYYDVWHTEKVLGLSKKLVLISKNKDCDILKKWLQSIKNHMYWTAASSTSGPERVAKWTSILNHIRDVHTHEDPAFPQCLHAPRTSRDKSKWLKAGTEAFCKLEKALTNKRILKDVEKMSPHHQTSSLEAFHRVILRFAPKWSFLFLECCADSTLLPCTSMKMLGVPKQHHQLVSCYTE
ncbi:hypothetical protein MATL_G00209110 [Megalops atlanticus]|uniref:Uncharacterized protein n=1 Tax=Megalops atlanticus TaxID=7932 RepID=A0A9D3PIX5_MEGAT|nr:hypothetical protein MATL_G00209110 [Megalops atlanticus]